MTNESVDSFSIDTTIQSIDTIQKYNKEITSLPFGPNAKSSEWYKEDFTFYAKLISRDPKLMDYDTLVTPIYDLPEIDKLEYIQIDNKRNNLCSNGKPVDSLLKLTKYRYRLPNVSKYESYYMTDCLFNHGGYPEEFSNNCHEFVYTCYGYLILYNTITKNAKVLDIYIVKYQDGVNVERRFYIDKNYKIQLVDLGTVEEEESTVLKKRRILIQQNGDLQINEE